MATATASGIGAVAPELGSTTPPRQATLTRVRHPETGDWADQVLVTCFPGPGSYTGEDVVEISGHGGWLAPALVQDACVAAGARLAEPGEFTQRAYLHGKLDLVQAEAVLDLVEGRSRALHGAALHQLERGLSLRIASVRERLVRVEALLAHHLDFPEEDTAPVPLNRIVEETRAVEEALRLLLETAPEGELLREGALTVLAGAPNSGKSSLYNALLGSERAIVTAEPGTTRDALEASISLGGFPFRLVDTAGLREADGEVERIGIEVARRYLRECDLVLFCAEAGRPLDHDERAFLEAVTQPALVVRTKSDLLPGRSDPRHDVTPSSDGGPGGEILVSVVSGEGLGELRTRLPELVFQGLVELGVDVPILTRERQRRQVAQALAEVRAFGDSLEAGVPAEVASTHLRPAETALEELVGVISNDEVLGVLFAEFCIGK